MTFVDFAVVEDDAEPAAIGPDEVATDHPCTDTSLYAADRGLLAYMLQDVRALVRLAVDGTRDVIGYEPIIWFVHGLKRRIVPCDMARLVDGGDCGWSRPLGRDGMCKDGSSDRQRTQVPVEVLGLSVRPTNCLKRGVIETVEQLISQTSDDLMALPNFEQTSLDEIVEKLRDHDLKLARVSGPHPEAVAPSCGQRRGTPAASPAGVLNR